MEAGYISNGPHFFVPITFHTVICDTQQISLAKIARLSLETNLCEIEKWKEHRTWYGYGTTKSQFGIGSAFNSLQSFSEPSYFCDTLAICLSAKLFQLSG